MVKVQMKGFPKKEVGKNGAKILFETGMAEIFLVLKKIMSYQTEEA